MAQSKKVTQPAAVADTSATARGIAQASMIIGIIAIVFCWMAFWGFVISGVALGFGIYGLAKRAPNRGMALAGTILGAVGLLLNIVVIFAVFLLILFAPPVDVMPQPYPIQDYPY